MAEACQSNIRKIRMSNVTLKLIHTDIKLEFAANIDNKCETVI